MTRTSEFDTIVNRRPTAPHSGIWVDINDDRAHSASEGHRRGRLPSCDWPTRGRPFTEGCTCH